MIARVSEFVFIQVAPVMMVRVMFDSSYSISLFYIATERMVEMMWRQILKLLQYNRLKRIMYQIGFE